MIVTSKTACLLIVGLLVCIVLHADAKRGFKHKTTNGPSSTTTGKPDPSKNTTTSKPDSGKITTTSKPDLSKTTTKLSIIKTTSKRLGAMIDSMTTTEAPDDDDDEPLTTSTTTGKPNQSTLSGSSTKKPKEASKEEKIIERVEKDLKDWINLLLSESYHHERAPIWRPRIRWLLQEMKWIYDSHLHEPNNHEHENHGHDNHEHGGDDDHQHWRSLGRKEFIRLS